MLFLSWTARNHLANVQRWPLVQATRTMSNKLIGLVPAAAPPWEGGRFVSTIWEDIRAAQRLDSKHRPEVLGPVLSRYWKPLYALYLSLLRSQPRAKARDEAEDLVQDFLTMLMESDRILNVREGQGRFRDWLVVCARNFMFDHHRRAAAKKRRPQEGVVSLESLRAVDGDPFEPADTDDPEQAFRDSCRRDLLERALREVQARNIAAGREVDFNVFSVYYLADDPRPTWKQVAERFDLRDWKEAAYRSERIKGQLADAIRDAVRRDVDSESEVDEEIRELLH